MKYHSTKITVDGEKFDSKREYKRYLALLLKEKTGEIEDLKRQVKFVLIPSQYEIIGIYSKGKNAGQPKKKLIEREVSYIADFTYIENGERIVEDSKGFRTADYKIKRKLMYYFFKIKVRET